MLSICLTPGVTFHFINVYNNFKVDQNQYGICKNPFYLLSSSFTHSIETIFGFPRVTQ